MSSMNKAIHHSPVLLKIVALVSRLRASFHFEVPVGYQDETGFHYGTAPRQERNSWPLAE
jgi:hypothetical protein